MSNETSEISPAPTEPREPLMLKIAPHMVQDLGINLYTSLPKVLVEFVANAHDADSPYAAITFDAEAILAEREKIQAAIKTERDSSGQPIHEPDGAAHATQNSKANRKNEKKKYLLPASISISIKDEGHGMSRTDIQEKFLVAGRRRREVENTPYSLGGRLLMGRKGLGKLAGFGVAEVVVVTSRIKGNSKATQFTMDFVEIQKYNSIHDVPIPESEIDDPSLLPNGGTIVELKRLLYEPVKASLQEIKDDIAAHFYIVKADEFVIKVNGDQLDPSVKEFAYAYPEPDLPVDELVTHTIEPEDGDPYEIQYRIRFVVDRKALFASQRGVRVYAHQRLAAMPSLLDADTNMHGFRMTDYLDGVVFCDAIDDQDVDFVATDRQGLRWDTPMLSPLREFLSGEIKEACKQRQKARDFEIEQYAIQDPTVTEVIAKRNLSKREAKTFRKIAAVVSSAHKKGFEDPDFKSQIEVFADAYVQGELFGELKKLAADDNADFREIASRVVQLTSQELDAFFKFCRARLAGIEALRKIQESVNFTAANNEGVLHELLNKCPWLIDPTFFEFLTSNKQEGTVLQSLEKELAIGRFTPPLYNKSHPDEVGELHANKRPDLVFLLGSMGLRRIIIVELKAPNTPLHIDHLTQLEGYMGKVERWVQNRADYAGTSVQGYLIGSHAVISSKADKVETLRYRISKLGPEAPIHVFGIDEMLERTRTAHKEILDMADALEAQDASLALE